MSKFKKITSVMLAIVMICLPIMTTTGFAMNNVHNAFLNKDTYSSNELYKGLRDIGFSDAEIMNLYQKEADQTGQAFKVPKALAKKTNISSVSPKSRSMMAKTSGFPSNPREGDVHSESYKINFNSIARTLGWTGGGTGVAYLVANCSKQAVARAIISSTSLGIFSAALSVAGLIFSEASRYHEGMTVTIKYHYIYSNNMILEWVPGPMSYKFW
ncbi:hypothetical protein [Anaerophilus nitritogenes]|uniref:hypothetical protein n=1 Tax=Anaerophilus nitritogenes TaxID=2498136 RepID=UPI00101D9AF5|nr:hypothetical protein [Anaerophilus nitritogenes]